MQLFGRQLLVVLIDSSCCNEAALGTCSQSRFLGADRAVVTMLSCAIGVHVVLLYDNHVSSFPPVGNCV